MLVRGFMLQENIHERLFIFSIFTGSEFKFYGGASIVNSFKCWIKSVYGFIKYIHTIFMTM